MGERLSDEIKASILLGIATGALQQHLELTKPEAPYEEIRSEIVKFGERQRYERGPTDMDIGELGGSEIKEEHGDTPNQGIGKGPGATQYIAA